MKFILIRILAIILSLFFVGCENPPRPEEASVIVANGRLERARFEVIILAEFEDNLAYGGKRRIYEIIDTKTHQKYLGVTGMELDKLQADNEEVARKGTKDDDSDTAVSIVFDTLGY